MGIATEHVRRENTALLIEALRRHGPASRAELAQRTGLAKATVGAIVAALDAAGAIEEGPALPTGRGRPGRPVSIGANTHFGLGLELNVDFVAGAVLDLSGRIHSRATRAVATGADDGERELVLLGLARDLVADEHLATGTLVGATVAVPGLVRGDERRVAWTPNLGVTGSGLVERLADTLDGCPDVRVSNDANCAAYAEAHHGASVDVAHSLYLTGTVGIGAGIITGGAIVSGGAGFAGEVGHLPVGDPTARCGCGRTGCWEAQIGLNAVLEGTGLDHREDPFATAAELARLAEVDPAVRARLERLGHDLGSGIAMLTSVLDSEVVVVGGYFVPLGALVLEPARRALDEALASRIQVRPHLLPGALGVHAAAVGAAEQSLGRALHGDLPAVVQ